MRKKMILGSVVGLLLLLIGLLLFGGREKVVLPKEGEVIPVELTETEIADVQVRFHNEALGFIHQIYALDANRYLFYTRTSQAEYTKEYPGDQLVWVERTGDEWLIHSVYRGSYPIRLVLKNKHPYFTQKGGIYFVFYEGKGVQGLEQNGKGYIYQIKPEKGVEKIYETEGDYYKFGMDKQEHMVIVEKTELPNRNMYPSYFAPYQLNYRQYHDGTWETVQEKQVEPDLKTEYEKYEEKRNKK